LLAQALRLGFAMTNVDRRSKELERRAEEPQRTQAEIDLAKDDLALGVMRSAAL
jgi:hypothetical protein